MALFRKFFYRKPPDGLLEISERVFVFDCCFTTDILDDREYKAYIGGIVGQLRDYFPDASFMVFNFRDGGNQSQISNILSEHDMTVMEYPRQYEGCPILPMEMIHHYLRSSESWLSLGQRNVLLMHCERGGWPVLAFMLAALLIYRKQYTGEQKTLDMIYKQVPHELLQLMSPLNPLPSQLRYLQYVSRRHVGSEWPPLDRALTLDCIILRVLPNMDGEGGCRPIFRIYGQDPFMTADRTPKVLFSTPKRSKTVRQHKQADCELVKIDIHCHIQGDVVLECISLDNDLEHEDMMFRVMFNTAFIRSNILMLNRDEIDILWNAKDQFPKDFRTEVLLSDMDAASSLISIDSPGIEDKEGLPIEAFAKVQEIFSNVDWLDPKADVAFNMLQKINVFQEKLETGSLQSANRGSMLQEPSPPKEMEKPKFQVLENSSPSLPLGKQAMPSSSSPLDVNSMTKKIEPPKLQVSLQRPVLSKIISQRIPQTPLSSPAAHSNFLQGSPLSKYQSNSALGITALLEDHIESKIEEFTHPMTISPPLTASVPVSIAFKPLQSSIASIPAPTLPPPPLQLPNDVAKTMTKNAASSPPLVQQPRGLHQLSASEPFHSLSTQNSVAPLHSLSTQHFVASPQDRRKLSLVPPQPPISPLSDVSTYPSLSFSISPSIKNSFSNTPPPQLPAFAEVPPPTTSDSFSNPPRHSPPPPPLPAFAGRVLLSTASDSFSNPPPPPPAPPLPAFAREIPLPTASNSFSTLSPPPPPVPSSSREVPSPTIDKSPPPAPPLPAFAREVPLPTVSNSLSTLSPPPPPVPSSSWQTPSPTINKSAPPPPPPPHTGVDLSTTVSASSLLPTKVSAVVDGAPPPPPPPLPSYLSVSSPTTTSSAPLPPPLPPGIAPKDPVPKNSLLAPPVPPPPAPFANGLAGGGGTSPQSHSAGGNKNIPPIPGPPFGAKGRLQSRSSPRNQVQSKKTSLKPYHWLKLTRAVQGSLWAEAQKSDDAAKAPEFDMSELESLFSATVSNSDCGNGGKSNRRASGPKSDKIHLIDLRRAYNCEIMLTKVKVPLPDLMSLVLVLDDSALDVDQVDNLIKFCPTKEEMELLKNFNGDKESLGKCEQFFLELMKVPRVESKLRVFSFKIQFSSQVSDLRKSLNLVNSAAEEIRNSAKLKRIMQTILSLGNALNHGTARGSAIGFRLDSLLKLTDTRARNNKMTLMHYLCKVLAEKLPELLDFPKDLVSLEASTKIQLKYLAEEMQAISKGLEKVVQELAASENDGPVSESFCKTLEEFLGFAEAEVRSLASLYSSVGRNADALALYFGEDPARCPFEQVVSTLHNFVRMFEKAHVENCKQLEFEKKKAQKEAENEKMKRSASNKESESEKLKTSASNKESEIEKLKTSAIKEVGNGEVKVAAPKESEHLLRTPTRSSNIS